ncbi:MAG: hypothetical protein GFH27_549293n32 [Chloroflexi bacterium AL-W]|nr:hypothetical protein [Chloroflexi bacterium AL-N1]NOK67854.1 hypothetical protein [Chloroflexi bacterium AL-N10]NOK75377.1 hypothetical protein [Chloroflexi bacterium AL-N5]NOK82165.1 hypothetical protein [Chloroflexi bacterium AL-W]NOK90010.1 hypothetical protein [Chloroflexi bacterium AL-N15]
MSIEQRTLRFGPYTRDAQDIHNDTVPYFLAGRHMYHVGIVSGAIEPIGAEHLVGEMGGLWMHPVKVADGIQISICDSEGVQSLLRNTNVTEHLSHIEWHSQSTEIALQRRDFIVEDRPVYVALLTLHNPSMHTTTGQLNLQIWLKFLGCWFGGMDTGGGTYWLEDSTILGYDRLWQGRWGIAAGMPQPPDSFDLHAHTKGHIATLRYAFTLLPGQTQTWEFMLAADHQQGHKAAQILLEQLTGTGEKLLGEKIACYTQQTFAGVTLETPDEDVNQSFALAKANLHLLTADYAPHLPAYLLAGIPEYPQLFGCDTEYTVPGAVAAGFVDMVRSTLLALADYGHRACGRIPHEVTTNGRVFHPGNTQETPQFATACWDFFRWTGDLDFLLRVYPLCKEGVETYMPALWGGTGGSYPVGDAMVERSGMGPFKLDSVCYLFQALESLQAMAEALELHEDAQHFAARCSNIRTRFECDWWIEAENMYADSLTSEGQPQLAGHWTVVIPLQLGLASPAHAQRSLARIEGDWVNEWGLVHTRKNEELVWTLPTGLLALTAFRYGQADLGVRMLQNIAETTKYGTLGAFKELIPIGLCFVQLWSAGLYVQGIVEGLLGIRPLAHQHRLSIQPQLPEDWSHVRLNQLTMGSHQIMLEVTRDKLAITHHEAPEALEVRYQLPHHELQLHPDSVHHLAPRIVHDKTGVWLSVTIPSGQHCEIHITATHITLQSTDKAMEANVTNPLS